MNNDIENDTKIKEMCLKAGISSGHTTREYLFTINAVNYFYYNKNIGEMDIVEGFVDGPNDGGIDFILNRNDIMYIIQGKSSDTLSLEDIKNVFYKMCDTIENFDKNKFDNYSAKLKSIYLNRYDDLSDDKNIELVLFTNTSLNENIKLELEDFRNSDRMSNYTVVIYDKDDIEKRKITLFQGEEFVHEDSIELCETNNKLIYNNNGLIVNIKASSLKKLYTKHSVRGLFSFNLREHISQKNVDNGIEETIKNEPENFWFYNNGITIGCVDYIIDGNKIKLYDFSIINGAQTTTKIGNSKLVDIDHDFAIVCKIVKAKGTLSTSSDFISRISEASNSQKPIKPRDLKANSIEQKKLQYGAMQNEYPLAIEIKRGVKPKNYFKVEKWQRITNEYIGQLILGCILQRPGSARSGKITIFTSEKLYNQIYKNRKQDCDILYELVNIANKYEEFKNRYANDVEDVDLIAACKNGKFTTLAIVFYLYKRFNGIVSNYLDEKLTEDNIENTKLTLNYKGDDYEKKLDDLFKFIIKKLSDVYEKRKESLKLTSYSNFFKTDKTYQEIILKEIDRSLDDEWDKEKLQSFMSIFNDDQE